MANQVSTTFSINATAALNQLAQYQQQLRNTIQLQTQLGTLGTNPGGGSRGGNGGGGGVGGSIAGAIGGVLTVAAVTQALRTATAAVKESQAANRALSASATEAGKSYLDLSKSSKAFANAALISESAAARSTAQLQRLLTLAGEGEQLEKYQKGFLDLAAARGVAFDELDTLFQGIIAGTDDALNRFGKQDPSKLAEQYARSLGKSVEQLTEQEKILSRLKAFDSDFGLFNGANEDRINSFSGSVDRLNKTIDDIITNFSSWGAESRIVRDNLQAITLASGGIAGFAPSRIQEMIAAGQSDQDILRAMGGGRGPSWYDRVLAKWSGSPGGVLARTLFGGDAITAEYIASSEDSAALGRIAAERRLFERQQDGAETAAGLATQKRFQAEIKAELDARAKVRREAAEAAKSEQERLQRVRDTVKQVRDTIFSIAGQQNPFVTVFENAYQSLLKVSELTKTLGSDVRNAAFSAVRGAGRRAYETAQVQNALERQNLLLEAADFRDSVNFETLTAEQQQMRRMDALRQQLNSIGALGLGARFQESDAIDRQIVQLTQGLNPAAIDDDIRTIAQQAREREAGRLADQEREARSTFQNLNKILTGDGIKVVLGSGEQVVRIVNEAPGSATVTQRPSSASTNARYQ